jgi:hypothetical protein
MENYIVIRSTQKSGKNRGLPVKITTTLLTFLIASFSAWSQNETVIIHYLADHPPSFWITNGTDKTVSISLSTVEVKSNSGWRLYSQPGDPGNADNKSPQVDFGLLHFTNTDWLGPHEAGYCSMWEDYVTIPPLGPWRAGLVVKEQTSGQTHKVYCEIQPLCYTNGRYNLTFYLPANWQGYSVGVHMLEDTKYSPAEDKQVVVGFTPMFILRNPQWQTNAPYQDIPIIVFTRDQWDALHRGELWPSLFAGGAMDELWHNEKYVFAMSSRTFGFDDQLKCWKETEEIVRLNSDINKMPRLYPE